MLSTIIKDSQIVFLSPPLCRSSPPAPLHSCLLPHQWHIPPWAWILYRVLALLYTLAWCIHSGLLFATPKWLILLSHLTYCMLGVYYLTALVNLIAVLLSIKRFCRRELKEKSSGKRRWLKMCELKCRCKIEGVKHFIFLLEV